jgi:hypothetical protein
MRNVVRVHRPIWFTDAASLPTTAEGSALEFRRDGTSSFVGLSVSVDDNRRQGWAIKKGTDISEREGRKEEGGGRGDGEEDGNEEIG